MPKIFVSTDNSVSTSKIYKADKMGKSARAAEKKMQEVLTAAVNKAPDFTADTAASGKGYTIRIEVKNVERTAGKTIYTLHPEIVRFPSGAGKGGGKGQEMVSLRTKDPTIDISGSSEAMLLDGVESATENIVKASLIVMRLDMTKR
jgi:hypothetical protein